MLSVSNVHTRGVIYYTTKQPKRILEDYLCMGRLSAWRNDDISENNSYW